MALLRHAKVSMLSQAVLWTRIRLDPYLFDLDPGVSDRIRILVLINDPISTFLVCLKAINTLEITVC
jgi:hypothetical protein